MAEDKPLVIVSGGQTGVDRGALDAALDAGIACGGWCPVDRRAEEGPIPAPYPVQELPGAGYLQRTRQNVIDSDGTLVIAFSEPAGGTARTVALCQRFRKPHLIIDAAQTPPAMSVLRAKDFVEGAGIRRLNVAGPRASAKARGRGYAYELVSLLIRLDPRR